MIIFDNSDNITITITGDGPDDNAKHADKRTKCVIFKNFAPLTDYISIINNTQIDNAQNFDVAMPMLCQKHQEIYGRDKPNDTLTDYKSV